VYWYVVRPQRWGIKVLLVSGKKVVLVRHSYSGGWNLPGGGFNPKREQPENAARRETRQELGVDLCEITELGRYDSTAEYKRDTVICFLGRLRSDQLDPSAEIDAAQWFSQDDLPSGLATAARTALQLWNDREGGRPG